MEQHLTPAGPPRTANSSAIIAALWLFATLLNVIKPFHMDDTAHLVIAAHILEAPANPMSGLLNWTHTAEPIFYTNQPHLFFYAMAAVMSVFGTSALALHLFVSVFTLLALVLIHRIATLITPAHALTVTIALGLSPGFVINQNVMVDMALFAFIALAIWAIVRLPAKPVLAFTSLTAALLIKYTSLFLVPVIAIAALFKGRAIIWLILPVLGLIGWSMFNIADFGQAHILNRPTSSDRGFFPSELLTIGLWGALSSFAIAVYCVLVVAGRTTLWAILGPLGGLVWVVVWSYARPDVQMGWLIVNAIFVGAAFAVCIAAIAGLCGVALGALHAIKSARFGQWSKDNHAVATIGLWAAGGVLFLITLAPFMATRHALLVVLPIVLLALRGLPSVPLRHPAVVAGLGVSAFLSVALALNDRNFAAFYADNAIEARKTAATLAGAQATFATTGHWGWQHYAMQAGIPIYDSERTELVAGDVLIHTPYVDHQRLPDLILFTEIDAIGQEPGFATTFDTRLLYAAGATPLPFLAPGPEHRIVFLQRMVAE